MPPVSHFAARQRRVPALESDAAVSSFIRTTHCDSLMRNLGCGFSQQKLGQNLGKESTPNRGKNRCREVREWSNQRQVRLTRWAQNPKVGGSNPPPATNAIIRLRDFHPNGFGFVWVR